jgi:hypothetical protein
MNVDGIRYTLDDGMRREVAGDTPLTSTVMVVVVCEVGKNASFIHG